MTRLLSFFAFLFAWIASAQDQVSYLDERMLPVDASNYTYKQVISATADPKKFIAKTFFNSGKIYMDGTSVVSEYTRYDGTLTTYFESGKTKSIEQYKDGSITGTRTEWYENGQKKEFGEFDTTVEPAKFLFRDFWNEKGEQTVVNGNGTFVNINDHYISEGSVKNYRLDGVIKSTSRDRDLSYEETYSEGKFVKGKSKDADGIELEYTVLEQNPEYVGGMKEFYKYVGNNFNIPSNSTAYGRLVVSFVVEKDGSVTDARIVKGLSPDLDKEAIRVVENSKKWNPGLQKGRIVRCAFSLPISIPKP